ncbi:hypothetical protein [Candidatus Lokiarchaeum ossiferum]|uniref:hypothetical protein n=1 Tax=Candidatus Lokiarchaeum ossiferum TaxID=2951803 RepID=UPI00352DE4FC
MVEQFNRIIFPVEFLTPHQMIEKGAIDVLAKTGTYCAMRILPKDLEGEDFLQMMEKFRDLGIEGHMIPWPLLDVEDGYYANEITVELFHALVQNLLEWYKDHGFAIPEGVLVDLEPPTDPKEAKIAEKIRKETDKVKSKRKKKKIWKKIKEKTGLDKLAGINGFIKTVKTNMNKERFEASFAKFTAMQEMMHEYGTKAIAVALPLAYEDHVDGDFRIQDFMTVPVSTVDWDQINYMIFNTDYVSASKGIVSHEDYRHLIHVYAKEFVENYGAEKASITLGITNLGVADVRAVQTDPKLYKMEASALLAAGLTDLGIYALDGIMEQKNPVKWIETVQSARASDFVIDPEKIRFAQEIRRVFQAVDFISPSILYLIESERYKKILKLAVLGKL